MLNKPAVYIKFRSVAFSQLLYREISRSVSGLRVYDPSVDIGLLDTGWNIFIFDWDDFTRANGSTMNVAPVPQDQSNSVSSYVIVNMQKGAENRLREYFALRSIAGIFYLNESVSIITRGIEAILRKEIWVPRKIMSEWMAVIEAGDAENEMQDLSAREKEILNLVATGYSNNEIADLLSITLNTVKSHLYKIYRKIGVTNRINAAIWARENLLVKNKPDVP